MTHEGDPLRAWRDTLNRGDTRTFERRLAWDERSEADVRSSLLAATNAEFDDVSSAEWESILSAAGELALTSIADDVLDETEPIPFEEVIVPLVRAARLRLGGILAAREQVIREALAPRAMHSLERALLRELSDAAAQALLLDLSVVRSLEQTVSFALVPSRRCYDAFVNGLREARLRPLFDRYPVLGRILAVRATAWVASVVELAERVESDRAALSTLFGQDALGPIVDLSSGRGDTHCGGRAVAAVTFASGLTVMYKPRSMTLDQRYHELVEWLNDHGLTPRHRLPRILGRGEYGWMEFVRPAPAADAEGVSLYYRRAGALVCLGYVLGSGDLHAENVIAVGDQPVVIDLETMLCPPMQNGPSATPTAAQMSISVLRSLLLPFWNVGRDGVMFFHGGGLGIENPKLGHVEQEWREINTDRMERVRRVTPPKRPANVPHLDGQPMLPADHVAEILAGFRECYASLLEHRSALLAPEGAMDRLKGARVRVLIRDTHVYGSALRRSLHPRFLRDGFERSMELEALRLSVLKNEERLSHWPAFDAEQRDLEDLDYPYFYAHTDDTTLYDSRHVAVGRFCDVSAYEQLVERMERLGAADRDHQETLIRFIYAYSGAPAAVSLGSPAPVTSAASQPMAIDEAKAIACALESIMIADERRDADWVGIERQSSLAGLVLRRIGDRFFDGRAGTALFLATLDAVAGTGHAELAARALRTLRKTIRRPRARDTLADGVGIGAGFGMAGYVYTLSTIGRLTGDCRWIDDARLAAQAITPQRIAADDSLEVLGGAAGALLALVSLNDVLGESWLLDRARLCAERLLTTAAIEPTTRLRTWRNPAGDFVTGFAHGAGGIAAALLRAISFTSDDRYAQLATDALAFENAVRQPHFDAPPHLASAAAKARPNSPWSRSWCNGPVGVTLGQIVHGGAPWQDVVDAITAEPVETTPDHPCCGTIGGVELLLAAGEIGRARELMTKLVHRARQAGTYYLSRDAPDARLGPSFFQGVAGIGYHLLRTAFPERIPSALAFR